MSYDVSTMFEEIAPKSTTPPAPWFACPGCGTEYSTKIMMNGCREGHMRYGSRPTSMFPEMAPRAPLTGERKSEVFWTESGNPICGTCASKSKDEGFQQVDMMEPPVCTKCHKQIVPEPEHVIENPNFLPPSERADIKRLQLPRRDLVYLFKKQLHEKLTNVEAHSVCGPIVDNDDLVARGKDLDGRLTRAHGLYRHDPNRGNQRLPDAGYVLSDPDAEPVEHYWGPR